MSIFTIPPITWAASTEIDAARMNQDIKDKLDAIDALFNYATGHDHSAADKGKPIPSAGLSDLTGWYLESGTVTYASADGKTFTFTIPGNQITKYTPGTKIKLTQDGSTKYFVVSKTPTYSSPNTTVTVYGGNNYVLTATAITNVYLSPFNAPVGFPLERSNWDLFLAFSGSQGPLTPNVWYNFGSLEIPIGDWTIYVTAKAFFYRGGALGAGTIGCDAQITLSNAANTELSYAETRTIKCNAYREGGYNLEMYAPISIIKDYVLSAKETKYVNAKSTYAAEGIGCQSGSSLIARFNYV